jgi:hypothetical protein
MDARGASQLLPPGDSVRSRHGLCVQRPCAPFRTIIVYLNSSRHFFICRNIPSFVFRLKEVGMPRGQMRKNNLRDADAARLPSPIQR